MNEYNEKISAWLDNGIEFDEIESLQPESSHETCSVMTRYNIIGDALRNNITDASMIDISASVREAIANEPSMAEAAVSRRKVGQQKESWFGMGAWLKPIGGLAVAASVAMVMVVTLTEQQSETGSAVVANVDQQPVQSVPVSTNPSSYPEPGLALPAVNLNSYVSKHSEYAAQDTMQGMMPYARAVSYGSENDVPSQSLTEGDQAENPAGK